MTAPLTVTIGGVSYPTFTQESITINSVMGKTISTCSLTIFDKSSNLTVPLEARDIVITRTDNGEVIFGGLAAFITDRTEGVSRYFDIQGQGYTILLDSSLVYAAYTPSFAFGADTGDLAILEDIFANKIVLANGTLGASEIVVNSTYVQQGSKALSSLNFVYSYAREVLELLANYVGFDYYVDFQKNLHYYYRESTLAPFGLSSIPGEVLTDDNGNVYNSILYRNLKRKRDATRIRNNYIVFGGNVISNLQTGYLANNGASTIISTAILSKNYPLAAPPGNSTILVWVNQGSDASPVWASQNVGIANVDSLATKDCLFDPLNQVLTFAIAPPNLLHALRIQYVFTYQGGQPNTVQDSITQYVRTFSTRLTASDVNSAVTMQTNINNQQQQFSRALQVITVDVSDVDFPGGNLNRFKVGQWVPFHNHIHGFTGNYWIHAVTTKILGGVLKGYTLELRNWTLQ